jgi:hypothetical protein
MFSACTLGQQAEKDREREKENARLAKEEAEGSAAISKRRRLKRGDMQAEMPANFGLLPPPPPPVGVPPVYEPRDRDRKGAMTRNPYMEEVPYDNKGPSGRVHAKDTSKMTRRDHDQYPYKICTHLTFFELCFLYRQL